MEQHLGCVREEITLERAAGHLGALDIRESAMLAGLREAPSQLNPIDNFEGARQRTVIVLDAMVENGKLNVEEATAAKPSSPHQM